jgi:LacI family transcriptional regulator
MPATLKDIAELSNVSVSTVSRVLNDRPGISRATRERVLEAARALNYVVNQSAQSLATDHTYNVGVVGYKYRSELLADPMSPADQGIRDVLEPKGYHIFSKSIDQTQNSTDYQIVLSLIYERRVDGLILSGPQLESRYIIQIYNTGIPIVLLDNKLNTTRIDCVLSENEVGAYEITRYLLSVRHPRQAVFLSGPETWLSSAERYAGYARAVLETGLEPQRISMPDTSIETGEAAMQVALKAFSNLDAVVAVNDATAWGAGRACRRAGLRVPEDVAIVGYDDSGWARLHEPPLTTVQANFYEIGYLAARRLIDLIERGPSPPSCTRVAPQLVIRQSCISET